MASTVPASPGFGRATIAGAALAVALALAAKASTVGLATWGPLRGAPISAVVIAVLLGIGWRNTVGVGSAIEPGAQWVLHRVLRLGIALVGLRLTLAGIESVGAVAALIVVACIATALAVSAAIGRALGLSTGLTRLLAVGTAVCGCTAVAAVSPALRAKPAETGLALTCVVVVGCAGMLAYPWLADAFFHGNATAAGVFLGTSIHDTSQVMGAAMIHAQQFGLPDTVAIAGFTKLLRNLSMLALIPLAAWVAREPDSDVAIAASGTGSLRERITQVLPPFLVAFVVLAFVRTAGDAWTGGTAFADEWSSIVATALAASDLLLVVGMTAVGLGVSLRDLRGIGWRALGAAIAVAIAVAASSLLLTRLWLAS
jgi:uncharacterized integral membrane protein (TIGR00698 family)